MLRRHAAERAARRGRAATCVAWLFGRALSGTMLVGVVLPGLAFLGTMPAAHAAPPESPAGFVGWPRALVEIRNAGGDTQRLNTTVADTPARQEQGLMFVRALDVEESMWFPQERPRLMQMWMKNTLIPLDMLFVDARGRIACVAGHTTPQSLALISCPAAASGVLEIGAGEAERRGIRVGDQVAIARPSR